MGLLATPSNKKTTTDQRTFLMRQTFVVYNFLIKIIDGLIARLQPNVNFELPA
jgi:hypothetical protein